MTRTIHQRWQIDWRTPLCGWRCPSSVAWVKAIAWIIGGFLFPGCYAFTSSRDVSHDSRYFLGFAPGQIYRLRSAGSIVKYTNAGPMCVLEAQDFMDGQHNKDFPKYTTIQVLPPGSRIRVDRLMHTITQAPIQGESYLDVFVTSLDEVVVCTSVRMGWSMSGSKVFNAPNTWPTVVPVPSALNLEPDDKNENRE